MIWFEYKYTTSSDIMNNIKLLTEYNMSEISILFLFIIIYIILLLYIIPFLSISYNEMMKKRKIAKRKKMIQQIAIQKDINDEIEKELNIHSLH